MQKNHIFFLVILLGLGGYYIGRKLYLSSNLKNGNPAPEFSAINIEGKPIDNETFKGQYLLVDFWGSWCGPCRKESPILRDLVLKFKDAKFVDASGFEILSVGIESSEARWKKAIQKDQLIWPNHISSFTQFKEPMAMDYDIKSIPQQVLIGPHGNVVLVNVGLNDIDSFLSKKMK